MQGFLISKFQVSELLPNFKHLIQPQSSLSLCSFNWSVEYCEHLLIGCILSNILHKEQFWKGLNDSTVLVTPKAKFLTFE